MSSQILLIAGLGVAVLLMSSQRSDKIIKGKRPELPVEMPVFSKQAVPLEQKNHLGNTPYILPSPLSNLGRDSFLGDFRQPNMKKMGIYSSY
jgi:hypothetical protein